MPRAASATASEYLAEEKAKQIRDGLSRVEGHVRAVRRMVDERRCCDELLTQLAAVKSALNRITVRLVEDELACCLTTCGRDEAGKRLDAAMAALSSMLKHG